MPEIGNRAPVLYGLFLVGQDKLPFGKLAVRHGLQLVHRCGGKRDNQSLQYTNCAVEKLHINLAFCRCAAQKKLLKMKMPPLFLGGCVLVGQIYFVYVKGFIGLYDCRTGRHIPFHVKSVSFVEVGKVFVVRVFRDVVFVA